MSELQLGFLRGRGIAMVRQVETTECGHCALAMVANFYGMNLDAVAIRSRFPSSARGTTLRSIIQMSDQLGLASRALQVPLESLAGVRMPAILHWNMQHYVVIEKIKRGKALIHDPAGRSHWMALDDVSNHFSGVALELWPAENFAPEESRHRLKLRQLWSRVVGLKSALLQTLVLSLVLEAFALASPYYMQIAIDTVLPALDYDLLTVLAIGFGLFTLINVVASFLRAFVLLSAGSILGVGIGVNVARKLYRLPISWFEKRQVGDILSRFQSITPIRMLLTEGAVASVLDGTLAVFTFVVMALYSVTLALIALVAVSLYAVVRLVSFRLQRIAEEEAIIAQGREQTLSIESIQGIVSLRLFNREATRLSQWQSRYVDAANANIAAKRIGIWQRSASTGIFGIELVISIWLAISMVMDGGFSIGMVYAFLAYKALFMQRIQTLIENGVALKMLGLHLERISDIALTEEDISFQTADAPFREFKGNIELRDVRFAYSPHDPEVVRGVNLVVEAGQHVAVTGPSGGGKSTIVKILLGLLEPDSGQVLVDGAPLRQFGHKNFHDQISAVLQNDNLFAGSLAQNIALFDDDPDRERIMEAAKAAAVHDDIMAMPMTYETMVGDMGSALSGGQKQRVLLARALYRKPRLLIVDEGTSHLDVQREAMINETIAAMGITRIIIAHRLETIKNADTIYVMNNGVLSDATSLYLGQASSPRGDPAPDEAAMVDGNHAR
jgi:ATP-binding cassette subfamily B protein RaxB